MKKILFMVVMSALACACTKEVSKEIFHMYPSGSVFIKYRMLLQLGMGRGISLRN